MQEYKDMIENAKKRCDDAAVRLGSSMTEMPKDDQVVAAALINISGYVHFQLERLESWLDETTDLLAWVGRNLLEVRFLLKYLTSDRQHVLDFVNEVGVDWKELLERIVALKPEEHSGFAESLENIIQHKTSLGHSLKRVDIRPEGSSVAIYKYYSKHIHPSSWMVNNLSENLHSRATRILFRANAIDNALVAVGYLSDASQRLLKCHGTSATLESDDAV